MTSLSLYTFDYTKPDGRIMRFYSRVPLTDPHFDHPGIVRGASGGTAPVWRGPELRRDRLTGDWISLSAARQGRPHLPGAGQCPLCPAATFETAASSELPFLADGKSFPFQWVSFENLYPALWLGNGTGHCEVVLFRTAHEGHFADMTHDEMLAVVSIWQDRSRTIGSMPGIQSVFLFENRGAEIGVTLHHPHGQIYAFAHLPPRLRDVLQHADRYHSTHMSCLICDEAKIQEEQGNLVVFNGTHLIAFMPEAPRFPYEVHITTKAHRTHIEDLTGEETTELARLLPVIVAMYDSLFGFPLPYIMQHHQCPSQARSLPSYHWNIQITPFHRSKDKIKYLAGAETGAGFFVNDSLPEEKVLELRQHFDANRMEVSHD
jgi:UDPglucose--hexose-1-phosphate uridylyltransferase